jgi:acyl-CoA synthetase (AMP-forming)/AMP-acid ligase II
VEEGDGIALMCSNRLEFVEVCVAAERAGLRLTPVNWHLNGEEAGYIVDDCEAVAFVADARFAQAAAVAAGAAPRATVRLAVGGAIEGFEDYEPPSAPRTAPTSTTRCSAPACSTPRARPGARRACTARRPRPPSRR